MDRVKLEKLLKDFMESHKIHVDIDPDFLDFYTKFTYTGTNAPQLIEFMHGKFKDSDKVFNGKTFTTTVLFPVLYVRIGDTIIRDGAWFIIEEK